MNYYSRVELFVVSGVCLVLPLGLLYVVLKHMVDRYNMYYAYVPTKLSQRIHRAAISQVMVAPVLCMFWLLFFSVLRLGMSSLLLLSCCVFKNLCLMCGIFSRSPHGRAAASHHPVQLRVPAGLDCVVSRRPVP